MNKNIYRRLATKWPIKDVSRKYYGQTVFLPRASYSDLALHGTGEFEAENCDVIIQLSRPKTMMLDVGTNFGLMSIPVLTKCPDVNVLSFEPSENALKFLRRTMDASRFKNRWELIEKCAGAKEGTTEFTLSQEISAEFDGMRHTKRVGSRRTCRVPVTTVDEEWRRRNCPEVSIIKCDVEGAEMEVLYGAVECINRVRPYIMMEWNRINIKAYDVTSVDLIEFINKTGYDIYALPGMIRVASDAELDLQAIVTETFLLSPQRGSRSNNSCARKFPEG